MSNFQNIETDQNADFLDELFVFLKIHFFAFLDFDYDDIDISKCPELPSHLYEDLVNVTCCCKT